MGRVAILCWICLATHSTAFAQANSDERFLNGLRKRQLFDLAETVCQKRLSDNRLKHMERVRLTNELIRVYTDRAVNEESGRREAWREKAEQLASQFQVQHGQQPRAILVRVQQALTALALGELSRMEAEVSTDDSGGEIESARQQIRLAARALQTIDKELNDLIPTRRQRGASNDELNPDELTALQLNVRYQLARAYRVQALCYAEGSPDQFAALTQALEQSARSLREIDPRAELAWSIRLSAAICNRLLGNLEPAWNSLVEIEKQDLSASLTLAARAEQARLLLTRKQLDKALGVLKTRTAAVHEPEHDFASLEVAVAHWRAAADAKDKPAADSWRQRSLAAVLEIEQRYGPYWGRRADRLIIRAGGIQGTGSVEILRRTARDLFARGQMNEALIALDRAAQTAAENKQPADAFELYYQAGLMQQQRSQHGDAFRRFRKLALQHPQHTLASNAHLLAVVNASQAARADSKLLSDYAALLEEHLQQFAESDSADRAAFWLGQLREQQQAFDQAILAYGAVRATAAMSPQAVRGLYRSWLRKLGSLGDDPTQLAAARKEAWIALSQASKRDSTDRRSQIQAELALARMALSFRHADIPSVELRLQKIQADETNTAVAVETSLLQLALLATQADRESDVQQAWLATSDWQIHDFVELSDLLPRVPKDSQTPDAASIARMQLLAIQRALSGSGLDNSTLLTLKIRRAAARRVLGDSQGAIGDYARLVADNKRRGDLLELYAESLVESTRVEQQREGLNQWRLLASRSKPRSARWFRAKLGVAKSLVQLGDKEAAGKLIRYMRVTEDLVHAGFDRQFAELENQLD